MKMGLISKVSLIPWDPLSESHRELLYKQRVECTWDMDQVNEIWRDAQIRGEKCIYWIISEPAGSEKDGSEKLIDTATSINAASRQPSEVQFVPIGHISLDSKNKRSEHLDLDIPKTGVFWINSFFIQHFIQGKGLGRAAMDEVEAMAVREPLLATTLMLSTIAKDTHVREDFAETFYGSVPKLVNQDWYSRRGYRGIKIVQNFFDVRDRSGKKWDTQAVFMRKDIL